MLRSVRNMPLTSALYFEIVQKAVAEQLTM